MRAYAAIATRRDRPILDIDESGAWTPDDEVTLALRAAGASTEDVERYLESDRMDCARDFLAFRAVAI